MQTLRSLRAACGRLAPRAHTGRRQLSSSESRALGWGAAWPALVTTPWGPSVPARVPVRQAQRRAHEFITPVLFLFGCPHTLPPPLSARPPARRLPRAGGGAGAALHLCSAGSDGRRRCADGASVARRAALSACCSCTGLLIPWTWGRGLQQGGVPPRSRTLFCVGYSLFLVDGSEPSAISLRHR